MVHNWIENNYNRLRQITHNVTKENDIDDIFQVCIEQLILNNKSFTMEEGARFYFFTKIVRNNYYSKTSPYYYSNKKFNHLELRNIEVIEEPYEDFDEMMWVHQNIDRDKKTKDWYYARLFEIFISNGCSITKTQEMTTIPRNSVSRDINKYRKILIDRRKKRISEN